VILRHRAEQEKDEVGMPPERQAIEEKTTAVTEKVAAVHAALARLFNTTEGPNGAR
jgi:hypothetical protein